MEGMAQSVIVAALCAVFFEKPQLACTVPAANGAAHVHWDHDHFVAMLQHAAVCSLIQAAQRIRC
jgi:hypothetical protein